MKVAMVSEHASPLAALGGAHAGGQNVHVAALAAGLAERGHEVVVHTRREDPTLPERVMLRPGVTVHHIDAGPPKYVPKDELVPYLPAFTGHLMRIWGQQRPDLVHAHFWMSGMASSPAAAEFDIPLVITFHALGSVKQRHQAAADTSPPARIGTERALARSVAGIIATCSDEVSELRAMGAALDAIDVIPCGVDTAMFRPRQVMKPLPQQPFRLLSIGRLVPREGVVDAIEALTLLPECELLVAGGPPKALLHHDREAVRLRARAEALGLHDRVTLLGALPREAVPQLIANVHAVVCLPWYEPFGIVPLEAMASGVPVIGSAVGGLLDTVEDGRTGFLVPPRSPHSAGRAVRRLVDSELLRQALGRAGRAAAVAKYDWSRVAEATEASYAAVLGRQHGAIRARRGVPRLGGPRVAMAGQTASVRLEGVR